jgi:Bacterial protein of unknown function (DUF899)
MGWSFNWLSSLRTDLNYDFEVSIPDDVEHAGLSAFALENGLVYHTYSCYSRGLEAFNSAYQLLDRAPRAATRTSCRCRSPGFGATTSTRTRSPRSDDECGNHEDNRRARVPRLVPLNGRHPQCSLDRRYEPGEIPAGRPPRSL